MEPLPEIAISTAKTQTPARKSTIITKYFFVFIGFISLAYVLAGFTPTYFLPLTNGSFSAKPVYHVHGIMYTLWILLIISQPYLIKRRLTNIHKKIGYAGLTLAVGMFIIGFVMAFVSNQAAIEA